MGIGTDGGFGYAVIGVKHGPHESVTSGDWVWMWWCKLWDWWVGVSIVGDYGHVVLVL